MKNRKMEKVTVYRKDKKGTRESKSSTKKSTGEDEATSR